MGSTPRIPTFACVATLGLTAALFALALRPASAAEPLPASLAAAAANEKATQGYLGVELHDPSKDDAAILPAGTAHGTEIMRVDHDGPAGKAGLREHDLILQFNGQAISGHDQLKHLLQSVAPGQTVSLLILRDGQQIPLAAVLETRAEVERRAWEEHITAQSAGQASSQTSGTSTPADPAPVATTPGLGFFHGGPADSSHHGHHLLGTVLGAPYTGLQIEPITPQLAAFFGVESGTGLLVRNVDTNSPALAAGFLAGDIIIRANATAIAAESEWTREMHESKGRVTPILIVRDHHQQTLSLVPDPQRRARLHTPAVPAGTADHDDDHELALVQAAPQV